VTCHAKYNDYPLGGKARKMKGNGLKSSLLGWQKSLKSFVLRQEQLL